MPAQEHVTQRNSMSRPYKSQSRVCAPTGGPIKYGGRGISSSHGASFLPSHNDDCSLVDPTGGARDVHATARWSAALLAAGRQGHGGVEVCSPLQDGRATAVRSATLLLWRPTGTVRSPPQDGYATASRTYDIRKAVGVDSPGSSCRHGAALPRAPWVLNKTFCQLARHRHKRPITAARRERDAVVVCSPREDKRATRCGLLCRLLVLSSKLLGGKSTSTSKRAPCIP
jgi:hypothetical protein